MSTTLIVFIMAYFFGTLNHVGASVDENLSFWKTQSCKPLTKKVLEDARINKIINAYFDYNEEHIGLKKKMHDAKDVLQDQPLGHDKQQQPDNLPDPKSSNSVPQDQLLKKQREREKKIIAVLHVLDAMNRACDHFALPQHVVEAEGLFNDVLPSHEKTRQRLEDTATQINSCSDRLKDSVTWIESCRPILTECLTNEVWRKLVSSYLNYARDEYAKRKDIVMRIWPKAKSQPQKQWSLFKKKSHTHMPEKKDFTVEEKEEIKMLLETHYDACVKLAEIEVYDPRIVLDVARVSIYNAQVNQIDLMGIWQVMLSLCSREGLSHELPVEQLAKHFERHR